MRATVLALCLVTAASAAAKPPSAAEKKAAKAHFDQGRANYEAGAYADAVREYEAAYALVPLPELQFNIGQAYRLQNLKPRAIDAYQRYLDAVPDGPLAEEARNHIAALKLRIQVDEAEAAQRKAAAEAEAARKRADEAEAGRKRSEADAAARLVSQRQDEERLRRLAAEEAEAARRRREAEDADYARRLQEAQGRGGALRTVGDLTIVAGVVTACAIAIPFAIGQKAHNKLNAFDNYSGGGDGQTPQSWSTSLDAALRDQQSMSRAMFALGITGASLIVVGVTVRLIGSMRRSAAVERLGPRRVSLLPVAAAGGGAFALGGTF